LNPGSALADFVEKKRTLEAITEEEPTPKKEAAAPVELE